jgi:hypothetical protein
VLADVLDEEGQGNGGETDAPGPQYFCPVLADVQTTGALSS